jgi:flagellar motility protein MotE (MotC chaperone)
MSSRVTFLFRPFLFGLAFVAMTGALRAEEQAAETLPTLELSPAGKAKGLPAKPAISPPVARAAPAEPAVSPVPSALLEPPPAAPLSAAAAAVAAGLPVAAPGAPLPAAATADLSAGAPPAPGAPASGPRVIPIVSPSAPPGMPAAPVIVPASLPPAPAGPAQPDGGEAAGTPGDNAAQYCRAIIDAARDARFARQAAAITMLERDLEERTAIIERKKAEFEQWVKRREEFLKKADQSVVAIYSQMRPDAASQQIAAMNPEAAAAILAKLSPRIASAILNEMNPAAAAQLTNAMAGLPAKAAIQDKAG